MSLSHHATLKGHVVGSGTSQVIHTYASSSCGASWGCHGGSSGGTVVCSGAGSSIQANCIEGGDEAAIRYGITGVCHQIANRIIAPAGITIPHRHPDITATYLVYGRYGWGHWPARLNQCTTGGANPLSSGDQTSTITFSIGSGGLMMPNQDSMADRTNDILEMLQSSLGHRVDPEKARQFAQMQAQFQQHQKKLGQMAIDHKISREAYVAELDEAMQRLAHVGEDLFGFADFHKVFGDFRPDKLFDTQTFILEDHSHSFKA